MTQKRKKVLRVSKILRNHDVEKPETAISSFVNELIAEKAKAEVESTKTKRKGNGYSVRGKLVDYGNDQYTKEINVEFY